MEKLNVALPPLFPSPSHWCPRGRGFLFGFFFILFSEDEVSLLCGLEEKVPTFVLRGFSGIAHPWPPPLLFSHVLFGLAQNLNGHFQ